MSLRTWAMMGLTQSQNLTQGVTIAQAMLGLPWLSQREISTQTSYSQDCTSIA
jgi:hypothetical protein